MPESELRTLMVAVDSFILFSLNIALSLAAYQFLKSIVFGFIKGGQ